VTSTIKKTRRRISPSPGLTLHSGAGGTFPNSPGFLEYAARIRPDITELDIRVTGDGVPVLSHDPEISFGNALCPIDSYRLKDLQMFKPDLLTLKQAAAFCRSRGLFMNLDMKTDEALEGIYNLTKGMLLPESFYLSGCHPGQILRIRDEFSGLRTLLNTEGRELESLDPEVYREYCASMFAMAEEWECQGLNVFHSSCRREMIEMARVQEIPVMIWTVNDEPSLRRFMTRGIGSITTDRPDLFRVCARRQGPSVFRDNSPIKDT
jgi:glycerophosphoryl diester phosphodiesterase